MTLENILPPRLIKALDGVKIELRPLSKEWGHYNAEEDLVVIDPYANRQKMREFYSDVFGISVQEGEEFICLAFHELSHREDSWHLKRIKDIEGETPLQTLELARGYRSRFEAKANEVAAKRFWDWRLNDFDRGDFIRWKEAVYDDGR